MKVLKSIIIDDSQAATEDLLKKLENNSLIEICSCANSFSSGIEQIREHTPDLLFLDIDMPDKSGFELLAWIKDNRITMPYIIFVTGHNDFSLKALREGALDYIIKPADQTELENAVKKASLAFESDNQRNKLDFILNYISGNKQLFLPTITGYKSVNTNDIVYIWRNVQSERVEIVFGEDDKLILPMNYSLAQLVDVLPKAEFFLVKRELIINIKYINEIETFNKDCTLKKGDFIVKLQMSRRTMKEFRDKMVL